MEIKRYRIFFYGLAATVLLIAVLKLSYNEYFFKTYKDPTSLGNIIGGYGVTPNIIFKTLHIDYNFHVYSANGLRDLPWLAFSLFFFIAGSYADPRPATKNFRKGRGFVFTLLGALLYFGASWVFLGSGFQTFRHTSVLVFCLYLTTLLTGAIILAYNLNHLIKSLRGTEEKGDGTDLLVKEKSFEQIKKKVETPYSVNIPYIPFGYKTTHYVNIVNPFMSSLILGTPGKGKTFVMILEYLSQLMSKGFTGIVYDYKDGDLTDLIVKYHHREKEKQGDKYNISLNIINFREPIRGIKLNPLDRKVLKSDDHCVDIVEGLIFTLNKKWIESRDFWADNTISYISSVAKFLRNVNLKREVVVTDENGKQKITTIEKNCCSLAHLIAFCLMDVDNYDAIYALMRYKYNKQNLLGFLTALNQKAEGQLAGMFGSVQSVMQKLNSPKLYYLTDEKATFDMNLNDPEKPQIVSIKYDNQVGAVYSGVASAYLTQACLALNQKNRLPSFIVIDEASTVFVKKLDEVIATGRSNKVATTLVFQDMSQIERDYGKKVSDALINTIGNKIAFQVDGQSAKYMSDLFGNVKKEKKNYSYTKDGEISSYSISKENVKMITPDDISNLMQGQCAGRLQSERGMEKDMFQLSFIGTMQVDTNRDKINIDKEYYPIIDIEMEVANKDKGKDGIKFETQTKMLSDILNEYNEYRIQQIEKMDITPKEKQQLIKQIEEEWALNLYEENAQRIYNETKELIEQASIDFQTSDEGKNDAIFPRTKLFKEKQVEKAEKKDIALNDMDDEKDNYDQDQD